MKKKILSLLVTGCLLFVPTTAFADDNKTVIKTVDDLLAFSKAVNNGDYDKNKDAVVVLENDLDLTGVVWTPIGNVFDENGYIDIVSAANSTETVILFQTLILRLFMVKICWSVSLAISRKQRYQV